MFRAGICYICGKVCNPCITCKICGRPVCKEHQVDGVCINCLKGRGRLPKCPEC